ncbi:putative DNA topoisomerase type I [Diachasmimorpha longicaudata entomopoxvirus]|uniref:DNA topoisomerase n=1 Tax=Diachasmimorpha longicaudata entomopoxvirus TaxID=109981 RepID=A0A7R5WJE9_9POXV|nr:putative DNA topoisomerase type I [Diachasmimorpha longicaudata entomopoxvirus]AKS26433.1 putative DNA topoisomerase type I [Diachasmimorpha longicaudata entomopoxvirus]
MDRFLCLIKKYYQFYTYDKSSGIVFDNGQKLPTDHLVYQIIQKYRLPLHLENIQITRVSTMEEADNGIVYIGIDKKGKTQYIYGNNFVQARNSKRSEIFVKVYNKIKYIEERINTGLKKSNNSDIGINFLFAVILLLELTFFIRLGKKKYFKDNETIGLLTLQKDHLTVTNKEIQISFKGKSNQVQVFHCQKHLQPILFSVLIRLLANKNGNPLLFSDSTGKTFTESKLYEMIKEFDIKFKDLRTYGVNIIFLQHVYENIDDFRKGNERFKKRLITALQKQTAEEIGHTWNSSKRAYLIDEIYPILLHIIMTEDFSSFSMFLERIVLYLNNGKKK